MAKQTKKQTPMTKRERKLTALLKRYDKVAEIAVVKLGNLMTKAEDGDLTTDQIITTLARLEDQLVLAFNASVVEVDE